MKAEYVDHMGTDRTVANAARVSFDKHHDMLEESDLKLIKYLASHNHWTPFAHPQIQLRMTAPVFVRTQCFKHKQGFVENEVSRRYVSDEPSFYTPSNWRSAPTDGAKQGSGLDNVEDQDIISYNYGDYIRCAEEMYDYLLNIGVAPEQARMALPQSMYTSWYWTGSLAAYARFYKQRTDPHAQQEIQDLAKMVGEVIEPLFPYSWAALVA